MSSRRLQSLLLGVALSLGGQGTMIAAPQHSDLPAKKAIASAGATPQTATTAATKPATPRGAFRLTMVSQFPLTFTLQAKDAPLTEIAAEFLRLLKVPIKLSQLMSRQRVTLAFKELALEAAMRQLAPQPIFDYVVTGDYGKAPECLAIYLNAINEPLPAPDASIKNKSQTIVFAGEVGEDDDEMAAQKPEAETPLKVTVEKNLISVRAKKQPLVTILSEIASVAGISFEVKFERPANRQPAVHHSDELVDVSFSNYTVEQAVRSVSPAVRFYYRTDLSNFVTKPLHIVFVEQR